MTTAYNEDKWISHSRYYYTGMDFAYTHSKKSQAVKIVTDFPNEALYLFEIKLSISAQLLDTKTERNKQTLSMARVLAKIAGFNSSLSSCLLD
jgi:hypothetical protein